MIEFKSRETRGAMQAVVFIALLALIRWLAPERSIDATGPNALIDAIFALGSLAVLTLLSLGVGLKALGRLKLSGLNRLETGMFSLVMGLGIVAYGVMLLGLMGLLRPMFVLVWLGLAALWSWRMWGGIVARVPGWVREGWRGTRQLGVGEKALVIMASLILGLSVVQALSPPWAYDSLMYHLQAPRLFLQMGRITLLPEIWQANGPMTIEMLYTIGLIIDSDVLAKLVHLTFAGLAVATSFGLGRLCLGKPGGWLSAAILLGIPVFPIWGTLAYVDMALVVFEVLAIYALILWIHTKKRSMLILGGIMIGFAIGSKYLALGAGGVLAVWIIWLGRKEAVGKSIRSALIFGGTAALVAAPWYLKNLLLSGNPVYPFFLGGESFSSERLEAIQTYLGSFGTGSSWQDYLLLPINLYTQQGRFGTSFATIDVPSFLFPLSVLYPFTRNDKIIDSIAGLSLVSFAIWSFGSQQTRFLLPIYPLLCVVVSQVLLRLSGRLEPTRYWRIIGRGLVGGLVAVTIMYQLIQFAVVAPYRVVSGEVSKAEFLRQTVFDYPALEFIYEELPEDVTILMMWDGQGYYCDERCIPDPDQTRLFLLTMSNPQPKALANTMQESGVTHILIDVKGLSFFIYRDVDGRHQRAARYFFHVFVPVCGNTVYGDEAVLVYEITCVGNEGYTQEQD